MKRFTALFASWICLAASFVMASDFKTFPSFNLSAPGADGQDYKVVGVRNKRPLIITNDGLQEAASIWMKCAKSKGINDYSVEIHSIEKKLQGKNLHLTVDLKSNVALDSTYAILTFTPVGGDWIAPRYSLSMPDLTGERQVVKLLFQNIPVGKFPESFDVRIYRAGQEIFNVDNKKLKDATPKEAFALSLGRYASQVGAGDAKPKPFYMPLKKPDASILPEGSGPVVVKVALTIEKSGVIEEFEFKGNVSPELRKFLSESIQQWLFFPNFVAGKPKAMKATIPLTLR